MKQDKEELKFFTMRMPKDIWLFAKTIAIEKNDTMTGIIVKCLEKYRKQVEKESSK